MQQLHTQSSPRQRFRITDLTVEIPSGTRLPTSSSESTPARWNTFEFKVYYFVAAVIIPMMVWIPVTLSNSSHPNYEFYRGRLSNGWLFGRKLDNSDAQYRSFRNNLPVLSLAAALYLLVNIKIITILTLNFAIAKLCRGSKVAPLLTWAFNGGILFANETFHGYQFESLSPALAFLDQYEGIYARWHILFNITIFAWSRSTWTTTGLARCTGTQRRVDSTGKLTDKQRQSIPHPEAFYSYVNYLVYALYPPLYIGGPIMAFNDFVWQLRRPTGITTSAIARYTIRFFISFFTMEFILHFMYVVAIKDKKAWAGDSPAEISMIGFWNLIIVWLKLLIPWRFFRLWALLDGMDPPENMVRCMANNYSPLGFWRSWHRSYNLWIIRYIYIPLGGARNVILNTVIVFSFVALWHDLTFRLLAWGWLVSLFIVPELAARYILPASKYGTKAWYRHVSAVGAVFNVLMMMGANLVGFVVGTDGIRFFVSQLFGTASGLRFLLGAITCLFVGVQLMFEYREEEIRNGIYRRC
ncbi:glycerol transporter [Cyathus striatus]|nr:glycerol transporter [Cyathus striatus]